MIIFCCQRGCLSLLMAVISNFLPAKLRGFLRKSAFHFIPFSKFLENGTKWNFVAKLNALTEKNGRNWPRKRRLFLIVF